MYVCVARALTVNTNLSSRLICLYSGGSVFMSRARHRVHLPTLGLDGQVYVCMCMGRYSV